MADEKISQLTADTAPTSDDLAVIVNDPAGTPGTKKVALSNLFKGMYAAATELTISSDAITVTQNVHKLQPESGTSDNLSTISGTSSGWTGILYVSDFGTDTITIKHNVGNILCVGGADIVLSNGMIFWYSNGTKVFVSGSAIPANPNLLMNGIMDVWQRGTSFAAIATGKYSADRWRYNVVGAAVHTITRDTDVPTYAQAGINAKYSLKLDCTTADASIAAGDLTYVSTTMEGYDYAKIKDKTVTLSFWVKATKTGTYCVSFRNNGSDRSYVAEFTISTTLTWEKKTVTVALNQSGGTENYTNGAGLNIAIVLAAGSTFQTTAGAWQSGNYLATSNQVAGADNTSNDFWITLVKLEEGNTATAYPDESFADTLLKCKRYYIKTFEYGTTPAQNVGAATGELRWTAGIAGASSERSPSYLFTPEMVSAPTPTFYNPANTNGNARDFTAAADAGAPTVNATTKSFFIVATGAAGTIVGGSLGVHFTCDVDF